MIGVIKQKKVGRNRWDLAPKIRVIDDPDTGKPKGDAVIWFEDPSSAQAAPNFFHNKEVNIVGLGKYTITCEVNKKVDPPPNASRRGGYNSGGNRGRYGGRGGGRGGDRRGGYNSGGYNSGGRGGRGSGGRGGSRPGDWPCPACGANNFASKTACFKCGIPKPGGNGGHSHDHDGGNRGGNVRPGDWPCPSCNANNYANKTACFKCGIPKPGGNPNSGYGNRRGRY